MKREIKVRVRYLNALMMPVEMTRNVSGKELEELLAREDVKVISVNRRSGGENSRRVAGVA